MNHYPSGKPNFPPCIPLPNPSKPPNKSPNPPFQPAPWFPQPKPKHPEPKIPGIPPSFDPKKFNQVQYPPNKY